MRTGLQRVRARHLKAMGADAVVVLIVSFLAFSFRYPGTVRGWSPWTVDFAVFCALAVAVYLTVNWFCKVYAIVPRFMNLTAGLRVTAGALLTTVLLFVLDVGWAPLSSSGEYLVPRSVIIGGGVAVAAAMV